MEIFNNISNTELSKLFSCIDAKKSNFKKDTVIISNMANTNTLGIIISGSAILIRVDYNGSKSIIEILKQGDVFESRMFNLNNNELSIISLEDTEVIFLDYDKVINCCSKSCPYHRQFIDNLLKIIVSKLNFTYERIQILTKKTIREKILEYFKFISYKKNSKRFRLPMNYSVLANYLAVDRSALMRELKNLKDDHIIETNGKIITLLIN